MEQAKEVKWVKGGLIVFLGDLWTAERRILSLESSEKQNVGIWS